MVSVNNYIIVFALYFVFFDSKGYLDQYLAVKSKTRGPDLSKRIVTKRNGFSL
jgi:hypothetical protein